ncbi:hypothetical protein Glove_22g93 [Diversispora epigaea]|uniref:Type I restriction enzyme R protein N-terminal domain-containing protein n=1 Tax=Diversispora epigaea TaxID=1348612 RepID=A0A397JTE3_9GLOM|nr:hypothetical protein Glove_22g93 [Diversispora epigaea]
MKELFGLKVKDFNDLPVIKIEKLQTPENIRNSVIDEILRKHETSPSVITSNEANRRKFIDAIIHGVASIYKSKMKIIPEYEVCGTHGPIDWVIQINNTIICVTEAKREDLSYGVGQSQCDDADLDESEMCCIVSTGVDWIITKVKNSNGGENNDEKLELFAYSPWPLLLPINNESITHDDLIKPVEDLFGKIKGAFEQQINSNKRIKQNHNCNKEYQVVAQLDILVFLKNLACDFQMVNQDT